MDIIDKWVDEIQFLDTKWATDWDDWDNYLDESQYSYIRLGLLLEKIRNTSFWQLVAGKFSSFRDWCTARMKLNIWQVNSYIEAAQVAIYLNAMHLEIPRNYSQAVALIPAYKAEEGYYGERPQLDRVWAEACKLKKITADAIKQIINPEAESIKKKVTLPTAILEQLQERAAMHEMTIDEYLEYLMELEQAESESIVSAADVVPFDVRDHIDPSDFDQSTNPQPEVSISPKSLPVAPVPVVEQVGNAIDRMRQAMYDRYLPNWKTAVSHE